MLTSILKSAPITGDLIQSVKSYSKIDRFKISVNSLVTEGSPNDE